MSHLNVEQKKYIVSQLNPSILENLDLEKDIFLYDNYEWYELLSDQSPVFEEEYDLTKSYIVYEVVFKFGDRYFKTLKFRSTREDSTIADVITDYGFEYEIEEVYAEKTITTIYTRNKPEDDVKYMSVKKLINELSKLKGNEVVLLPYDEYQRISPIQYIDNEPFDDDEKFIKLDEDGKVFYNKENEVEFEENKSSKNAPYVLLQPW